MQITYMTDEQAVLLAKGLSQWITDRLKPGREDDFVRNTIFKASDVADCLRDAMEATDDLAHEEHEAFRKCVVG